MHVICIIAITLGHQIETEALKVVRVVSSLNIHCSLTGALMYICTAHKYNQWLQLDENLDAWPTFKCKTKKLA